MAADTAITSGVLGLLASAVLALLGILGRRVEGRESRAIAAQSAALKDLGESFTRVRGERDEARVELTELRLENAALRRAAGGTP